MSFYYNDDNTSDIPLENRPFDRSRNPNRTYYNQVDYEDDSTLPPRPPPRDTSQRRRTRESPLPPPPPPQPRPAESTAPLDFNFNDSFHDDINHHDLHQKQQIPPPLPPKDLRYSRYSRLSRLSRTSLQDEEDEAQGAGVLGPVMSRANDSNDLILDNEIAYYYDDDSIAPRRPPPPPPPQRDDDDIRNAKLYNRGLVNVSSSQMFYDDDDIYFGGRRGGRGGRGGRSVINDDLTGGGFGRGSVYFDADGANDGFNGDIDDLGRNRSSSNAGLMSRTVVRKKLKRIEWTKLPWFCWTVSLIQVSVFISELAVMGHLTGSPIQTQPSFNPMIGPSSYVMINMGARFTPCMHYIANVTDALDLSFPCPNSTVTTTDTCSLSELCGMGGLPAPPKVPDQWWRFIVPIFLHAGFIHIGFNLLLQLKLGSELEKEIGVFRFVIVYFASGIAGFVLGGNFTPDGIASTGASGSIFGVIALDLLDLLFNWQLYASPKRNLAIHIFEIIISFVIGLLPGLDNFSHIGGFAMGVLTGTAILRSPLKIRLSSGFTSNPHGDNHEGAKLRASSFDWRHPSDHFRGRSRSWYLWSVLRIACVALAIVYFVTLIRQFENGGGHCSWCKYLSCLPVHGWCDEGNITTS